jgi:hypothetical protein
VTNDTLPSAAHTAFDPIGRRRFAQSLCPCGTEKSGAEVYCPVAEKHSPEWMCLARGDFVPHSTVTKVINVLDMNSDT